MCYLTDGNGDVTDTYDYDAGGNLTAASGDTVNYSPFTGEQLGVDLGLLLSPGCGNLCCIVAPAKLVWPQPQRGIQILRVAGDPLNIDIFSSGVVAENRLQKIFYSVK